MFQMDPKKQAAAQQAFRDSIKAQVAHTIETERSMQAGQKIQIVRCPCGMVTGVFGHDECIHLCRNCQALIQTKLIG